MLDRIYNTADYYLNLIRENKPFTLSRFGDGEVICMFHCNMKENCDGSAFLKELNEPMRQIFHNQYDYYHCILDCTFCVNGEQFKKFLEDTCPEMPLFDGEFWQKLSGTPRITELIQTISEYECVFIGGSHFTNIPKMKGFKKYPHHIPVPDRDSYKEFDRILRDILYEYVKGKRMFLFSSGYTSKILIDTLYPHMGKDAFLLDMGSVFDPYLGRLSRNGMVKEGFAKFQPYTNLKLI